jgi:plasmid stabilization system protein ParE
VLPGNTLEHSRWRSFLPPAKHPEIGRPVEELPPEFREWVIEFGQGACIALYRYDGEQVVILTVRHGREAGY